MKRMPAISRLWWRRPEDTNRAELSPGPSYHGTWDAVARFAAEIRASNFMAEMIRRRDGYGSEGVMGALDCATLYGLTRWLRPAADRKSTRLNSSHASISYGVFCLKE